VGLPDEKRVRDLFGILPDDAMAIRPEHQWLGPIEHWSVQQQRDTLEPLLTSLPYVMADSIGQSYVVPPFASAVQLSRLSMLYLVSYSLGMLARYQHSLAITAHRW
jgi:hypothetical protein